MMNDVYFSDFGIEIIRRNNSLYVRYDVGHFVAKIREDIISEHEAAQAMQSERTAYKILVAIQNRIIASGVDPSVSNIENT